MRKINRPECPNPVALEAGNYKHHSNKDALRETAYGKCMYCETRIDATYPGDVEHIKPKRNPAYKHLEFEWSNLGFVCWRCNNNKSDHYDENFPFIDPYIDEPTQHFDAMSQMIFPKLGDQRAEATIETIKLNREQLTTARLEAIYYIKSAADSAMAATSPLVRQARLETLIQLCEPNAQYSFVCRPIVERYLNQLD